MSDQPQITRLSLEDALAQGIIKPLPNNPNAGTSRGEYMVAASGEQFGAMRSIVLDRDGNIAAGNHTATVFAQEGIASDLLIIETDGKTLVAVKRNDMALDDPDAVDTLQYAIADNRASEVGLAWNFDVMQAVGKEGLGDWFTESEWEAMEAAAGVVDETPPVDVEPQIDKAEELQKLWQIERGQVWVIPSQTVKGGVHRVMCGDSTSAEDVARLIGDSTVDTIISDPPYAFGLGSTTNLRTKAGGWHDMMNNASWYASLYKQCAQIVKHGAIWLFCNWRTLPIMMKASWDSQISIQNVMVWYKDWIGPGGTQGLRPTYELICLSLLGGYAIKDRGVEDFVNVPFSSHKSTGHSAQKPVLLMEHLIKVSDAQQVLDLYLGSGTTLVACEHTGRVGYGMEIEPAYVAVILQRLTDMGLTPKLDDSSCVY